jgi:carboxyl-terminal processing protease
MKNCPTRLLLSLAWFITLATTTSAQKIYSIENEARGLLAMMDAKHFSPPKIDDAFAQSVFSQFIFRLDPFQLYLKQADILELTKYSKEIDNDLIGSEWVFFPQAVKKFEMRLKEAEANLPSYLDSAFNFAEEAYWTSSKDAESMVFPPNDIAYVKRWKQWTKYQTLRLLSNKLSPTETWEKATVHEKEMREKVKKMELRKIHKFTHNPDGLEDKMAELFLNAICQAFDPHSSYMGPRDILNFQKQLSKDVFVFGISFEEDEQGNIVIEHIKPGGSAWKSNQLHKGDILLELETITGEKIDVAGADQEQISEWLGDCIRMTFIVKKTNGMVVRVPLSKRKMEQEDNMVKSAILTGKRKVGYIYLPGFYMQWDDPSGLGCANDVASEVVKLKKEKIDALIVDVRFNGGGSMKEGVEMAGMFVPEGPISILKDSKGKARIHKDPNRGTIYDGPLLLMVNGQSASASELFAAALQDYKRGLVVGSQTFGKATAQIITPLDTSFLTSNSGFAKITIEKFYRVTTQSHQRKGVLPDITLPDIYQYMDYAENHYKNALPNDQVQKEVVFHPYPAKNTATLAAKSKTRIQKNPYFQYIQDPQTQTTLRKFWERKEISLATDDFLSSYQNMKGIFNKMETLSHQKTANYGVEFTVFDTEQMNINPALKENAKELTQQLQEDVYIEECMEILNDYIEK